jgi:hypothetical protein
VLSRRCFFQRAGCRGWRTRRNRGRLASGLFLLCGTDVRHLAKDVTAVTGVVASCPQGESLRVVADPLAELDLRRFAATHAASLTRAGARFEDAVLARAMPMGRHQT